MSTQRIRTLYTVSLVLLDSLLIGLAFVLAYQLRVNIAWPEPLLNQVPLASYAGLFVIQLFVTITILFLNRQYYIPRSLSRIDQAYYVFVSVSVGMLIALAVATIIFRNNQAILDYPRAMMVYDWLLTIVLLILGRLVHSWARKRLQDRGIGKDRVLIVGTGDTARMIIQRIAWSPALGYDLVGIVNGESAGNEILGFRVLGQPEDLPDLINEYHVDEVIIAMPEKGHREMLHVISYCERGRVTIKIFPDLFQYVTTHAGIDDLGGLPLLSVRDYALRGYLLTLKRLIDFIGATLGLIAFSPLMLLTALAIKLESPGPVFFIQPRMGLDGREFMMIKFRSMRTDAEKDGPGWTVKNDPRQTRLGTWLRRLEVDELPNLINVWLGEMSLVGPRPEQAYYVEQFRRYVPRYMDRHREKGGMTGWAQVNGLRGDSSISERTKYDLWYSENWSILLDTKILLRTVWQVIVPNHDEPRY
ncbi:MAG: undecaprenyl-phosphate glucose phosphotransferase [Candidatus Promineofilum sp.]|nr:undecaprenyl-phosphate glucose phosphotransferase [Promineifilum sp.]MCW5862861.1 undecaprenyl-phosphate glucose phosphotransferase [Anaerolineae bacterium]